ncbi:D-glucuronyl C5-epimerase family protein [Pseudomonas soli]|uniref:D-glucuronyl C5-epimerase family protein n=1 Tax=Pseudomonas soli TaxID=1306993 RepID=UPI0028AC6367|nr:D-glucuronyl C5-epimerase family protein [Pseudomonas soli]
MSNVNQRLVGLIFVATATFSSASLLADVSRQTNVDQAQHMIDDQGIPLLSIDSVGKVAHPAWTALYALAYAGVEDYDPSLGLKPDVERFNASVHWLKTNLVQNKAGLWVWPYNFDSTYNDVSIKAPWSSAFAQATGIQALLAHWKKTGDKSSLELARKAAASLFVPISKGGFLFSSGADIWFEEIPAPVKNPSHILNGHMRVLLALGELKDATGDEQYGEWFSKGSDTLLRWLPLYDAGYWLRYDLNPRKQELLFRLANPYGFTTPEVAIDRITLRDPVTGKQSVLDVGGAKDSEGDLRIAGNDWGQVEDINGHSVRRLRPVSSQREAIDSSGQMVAPYTYFYLTLPSDWNNNLRRERLELSVEYLDEHPGNLSVQTRSIAAASETFKSLQDGDLLLSGSGGWRKWNVAVQPKDLGYWVGETYARKHAQYLRQLAVRDHRLAAWADTAVAYLQTLGSGKDFETVIPKRPEVPGQTPMLPVHTLDKDGVVTQWRGGAKTTYFKDGSYNPESDPGEPVHSPFIIARQLLAPSEVGQGGYKNPDKSQVTSLAALNWFMSDRNQYRLGKEALTYRFDFDNTYNDIVTAKDWASAFSQAYVLKALGHALDTKLGDPAKVTSLLKKVAHGYSVPIEKGGIASVSKSGLSYFEEVPNATHVLNAHLISIPELAEAGRRLKDPAIGKLVDSGVNTLRSKLSQFDTGYWMRYDLNPKKEMLFQLDWLEGENSPLIEDIRFEAPQFAKQVKLAVGSEDAFNGASRITGLEWSPVKLVDGHQVRSFSNGYLAHKEAVKGGTRHNVYALLELPEANFNDFFDVRPHRLVVRFKDVSPGQFVVKIQSINEGNVLDFIPLRNAVISTVGDQQWKEAVVEVRPQDMGWYKGADYQVYEIEQLDSIAKLSGDWFFGQYAQRQRYFLDAKAKGQPTIIQPSYRAALEPVDLSVLDASPTYEGFGFKNALDGDISNNYVAGEEGEAQSYVTLGLSKQLNNALVKLDWESGTNHAGLVRIFVPVDNGWAEVSKTVVKDGKGTSITVSGLKQAKKIKIEFSDFSGQTRVLLRGIQVYAASEAEATASANVEQLDLRAMLEGELFTRLKKYSASPLFSEMTVEDARHGTEGNCSHAALWMAMKMSEKGVPYRVLDIKSSTPDGQLLSHAMTEVKIAGKWLLTDPLNGWLYPASIVELKRNPVPPVNHQWPGRKGMEVYKEAFFFQNLRYVEAYEDLAYTGLFEPKRQEWRYDLIGQESL